MENKNKEIDLLSIKEFAELVGITATSLRHYDNIGIFASAQRGIQLKNKYRYYSPLQITTVNMIRVLAEIGVPLETIKSLTENRTPEMMLKILRQHKDSLNDDKEFMDYAGSAESIGHSIVGSPQK